MIARQIFDQIFTLESAIAGGVFAVIALLLVVAIVRGRARPGREPSRRHKNTVLELSYTLVLAGFAAFLVVFTAHANDRLQQTAAAETPRVTSVDVTAYQWCWQFSYPGHPASVTGTCREDRSDTPTLVVPTGRPVELRLTSRDVVHAFWVPDLAVKKDAFPDHVNVLDMTFDHPGRWQGLCSEYCGQYHVDMHFFVRAVSPQEYEQFLQSGVVT